MEEEKFKSVEKYLLSELKNANEIRSIYERELQKKSKKIESLEEDNRQLSERLAMASDLINEITFSAAEGRKVKLGFKKETYSEDTNTYQNAKAIFDILNRDGRL